MRNCGHVLGVPGYILVWGSRCEARRGREHSENVGGAFLLDDSLDLFDVGFQLVLVELHLDDKGCKASGKNALETSLLINAGPDDIASEGAKQSPSSETQAERHSRRQGRHKAILGERNPCDMDRIEGHKVGELVKKGGPGCLGLYGTQIA